MFCPTIGSDITKLNLISLFSLLGTVFRDAIDEEAFLGLIKILSRLCDDLQAATRDDGDLQSSALHLQLTAECFRAQRNACVQSTRNQCMLRYFPATIQHSGENSLLYVAKL